jgi:hypothetical protein
MLRWIISCASNSQRNAIEGNPAFAFTGDHVPDTDAAIVAS